MPGIDARTQLFGLIGFPLGHTLSPSLHNAALAATGVNGVYLALPTPPERLADALSAMRAWPIAGLNVTVPHKVAVMPLLEAITPEAERIGAVNTISREGDRLIGHNTDFKGFLAMLDGLPVPERAVILGAGGSSRAVAYALVAAGTRAITFAVRRPGSSQDVVATMASPAVRWEEAAFGSPELHAALSTADVLVNTTPVGMTPHVDASPLDATELARLPHGAAVLDLIYTPSETRLMRLAQERGLIARNGLPMLIAQAAAAFTIWTGRQAPESAWQDALHGIMER
ncbi:Shikimate dehydrogenase [compost metagenome]